MTQPPSAVSWRGNLCHVYLCVRSARMAHRAKRAATLPRRSQISVVAGANERAKSTIADAKARLPAAVRLWQETLTEIATTDPRSMLVPLSPPSSNGTGEAAE